MLILKTHDGPLLLLDLPDKPVLLLLQSIRVLLCLCLLVDQMVLLQPPLRPFLFELEHECVSALLCLLAPPFEVASLELRVLSFLVHHLLVLHYLLVPLCLRLVQLRLHVGVTLSQLVQLLLHAPVLTVLTPLFQLQLVIQLPEVSLQLLIL